MQSYKKNKKNISTLVLILLIIAGFSFYKNIQATDTAPTLDLTLEEQKKIEKTNSELDKLNKKAETYEKILLLKQKQQTLLGSQINNLNGQIGSVKEKIENNIAKIEELNRKIDLLEKEIIDNERILSSQKKVLANILRFHYENSANKLNRIIFNVDTFSNISSGDDYYEQIGAKILEITANLRSTQKEIKKNKEEIDKSKNELIEARHRLEEESAHLASTKVQKNILLVETQGDEATYQAKLDKIERQKKELLGDIDELYNANYAEISQFASGLEKPTSGLASTSWYYSQKDPRWNGEGDYIGNSKSRMKDLGCAVSSVAMVFTFKGEHLNPKQLSDKPIFSWDLINWPQSWADLTLSSSTSHSGVSWRTIDSELKDNNPIIVFINARNGAGHYVVIHHKADNGKYVVHDPYWGPNIYLDSTIELLSKLYKVSISKSAINQMILYK